jgi:glutathione S-transferase
MYELWQTEWCPASRRVRQRLTELGIDYVVRQVPVERDQRVLLRDRTGGDTIPVFVTPNGTLLVGEDAIVAHLDAQVPEPPEAQAHRLKAEKARRRYLQEECECLQPATR